MKIITGRFQTASRGIILSALLSLGCGSAGDLFAQGSAAVAVTNIVVLNTATNPVPRDPNWVKRHEGFVAEAKQGGIDILFMGDSITDFWRNRGSNVWNKYYAPRHAADFGISGDRTQHVLWRMDNGELDGIKPKVAVVMIGTNNVHANTPAEVAEGITAIVNLSDAQIRRDMALVFRKDKALSRAALAFIDIAVRLKSPQATRK